MENQSENTNHQNCNGNGSGNECPFAVPFGLLQQRLGMQMDEFSRDLKRVVHAVEGNGRPGLRDRVIVAEQELLESRSAISEIKTDMHSIKQQSENRLMKFIQALLWLSAGGAGTAGLMQVIGGG